MSLAILCSALPCGRLPEMLPKVEVNVFRQVVPRSVSDNELERYHDPNYVRDLRDGWSDEWLGRDPERADKHISEAGGTLRLAEWVWRGKTRRAFSPNGLSTLPLKDTSVWGQTVNDAALAAGWLARRGLRVSLVDIGRPREPFSIPGVQEVIPNCLEFNDAELVAYCEVAAELVRDFSPDVVLYAANPAHLDTDPSTLSTATLGGYLCAAEKIAHVADEVCAGRVIGGGSGGVALDGWTEAAWAATCRGLALPTADARELPEVEPAAARGGLRLIRGGVS